MTTTVPGREMVPNDDLRRRLVALNVWHEQHGTGVTLDDLCLDISRRCFSSHRRGGRLSRTDAIRGVKVLLGLTADRWGGDRHYLRAYRANQLADALSKLEQHPRDDVAMRLAA